MELVVWWLLLLTCSSASGDIRDDVLKRSSRQQDWGRSGSQHRHGSADWHPRGHLPVDGQLRGLGQYGSHGRYSGGIPRQLPTPQPLGSSINVQCTEDTLLVYVRRNFYGNGILVQPSDLSLGPQSCLPDPRSNGTVILFQSKLQQCGNTLQTTSTYLIYSSILTYNPSSNGVIIRNNPAVVPVQCVFPRLGNVSSDAIKPTWSPFSTTVSTEDKMTFFLRLMTDNWSGPRASSVFQLGDIFNIEASVDSQNHADLILFVDRCQATPTDTASGTNYDLITANGCLVDGVQGDASSAFQSPRIQPDVLQFTIDAFRFLGVQDSEIYITCHLRAASANQVPDPMNKACSFSKTTNSWSAVEGSNNICQCCNSGICNVLASQARSRGSAGRPRGFGKRHIGHAEESSQIVLGPLLVIGAEGHHAPQAAFSLPSRMPQESTSVELLVLVVVASVSLVVVAAGVAVILKTVLKKSPRGETVEQ
ncbi:zona pellucida sperm-binding protein 3-like [Hyperolius riggenbachi]|uniref:zona pellucida sperm-binding protein 3-like n=1 Tax=Hyperolius riggenbachi TaxID=752182 RepID=UPI0035A29C8B